MIRPVALLLGLALMACGESNLPEAEKAARVQELYAGYRDAFPEAEEMTVEEFLALQATADPVVVDVRTDPERAISMIPGAISREEFELRREELGERPVVTYCTIGYRSGLYAEELKQEGLDAYNLEGSILAWTHAGQRLEEGGRETHRVHVYGRKWNLAADDYEPVW